MSWMSRLYQTYEQAVGPVSSVEDDKPIPVAHTVQNAHINIIIDGEGNFLDATVLQTTQIVLPATESSAGRSSGEAPHPLADKIQYVAGDYGQFGGLKTAYFNSYQQQLSRWAESTCSHPSVRAVHRYISKQSVVADLIQCSVLRVDSENRLLTSRNDQSIELPMIFRMLPSEKGQSDQGNALVCWTVEAPEIECADTWKDTDLQTCWIKYDEQQGNLSALCYVSGEVEPIALNHPAKLRHPGDKAKLISSNDFSGYTFKGRFTDTKKTVGTSGLQGATISYAASQKAHSTLRWLIKRQRRWAGVEGQVVVAWATSAKKIPHPFRGLAPDDDNWNDFGGEESANNGENLEGDLDSGSLDQSRDLGFAYTKKLNEYMNGYRQAIAANDTISVMGIDSATPGRMAVIYYREAMPKDYLDDITAWHKDFAWAQRTSREFNQKNGRLKKVTAWAVQAPAPRNILKGVYGDILKSNKVLGKQLYQRLLPLVLNRADIPQDILKRALGEASRFTNKEYWEWERSLGVACALYKGHCIRHTDQNQRRIFKVAKLDTTITSRDYLYGRLLALAEKLESTALQVANVKRPTTANRLMQRFADRPYSTWPTIYKQLDPYIRQLTSSRAAFLTNICKEIDEVISAFNRDEFMTDAALSGEYLLGFHCQRLALRGQAKNSNKDFESEQGE